MNELTPGQKLHCKVMDYDFEILIDLIRDNDKINYISNIRDLMSFLIEKSLNEYGTNLLIVYTLFKN